MRKIFKKVITAVASMAMLAGMVAGVPSIEAKAAQNYYVVGNDEAFGNWTPGNAAQMTYSNGKYTLTFNAVANKTYEYQILPTNTGWDGQIGAEAGGNFGIFCFANCTATITFDPSLSGDARVTCTGTGMGTPNLANTFYVVGSMNSWGGEQMTANSDGTFTIVYGSSLAAGDYEFKVAQDFPTYGWYKQHSNGDGNDGNTKATKVADKDLKITFNPSEEDGSKKIKVENVNVSSSGENQSETSESQNNSENATTSPAATEATTADSSFVAKDIKVKVKLDAAVTWDKVYLYSWNGGDKMSGDWPGTEATKEGDYYVITINAKTKYVNMIANNGSGEQTIDIENIDCSGDEVILNVSGEKNSDGKYVGTSPAQKTTTSGDTTPFVAIVAVLAMLGCAFVALNSKKARR